MGMQNFVLIFLLMTTFSWGYGTFGFSAKKDYKRVDSSDDDSVDGVYRKRQPLRSYGGGYAQVTDSRGNLLYITYQGKKIASYAVDSPSKFDPSRATKKLHKKQQERGCWETFLSYCGWIHKGN